MPVTDIGDVVSPNDIVIRQYEALPYPMFTDDDISKEKNYYQDINQSKPFYNVISNALENLNHFLFRGKESFRYHIFIIRDFFIFLAESILVDAGNTQL